MRIVELCLFAGAVLFPVGAVAQDVESASSPEVDPAEATADVTADGEGSEPVKAGREGEDKEEEGEGEKKDAKEVVSPLNAPAEASPLSAGVTGPEPTPAPLSGTIAPREKLPPPAPRPVVDVPDVAEQLDIDGFLETQVVTASRQGQDLLDVPASVVVVTAEDIKKRGYNNLAEIIQELPGFDISLVNGTQYMMAYQRGYRTPFTQRTLLMVDGKVDNNLWSHIAAITRQYPVSNIERVEVLYGPAAAVYGPNAFLGVINIITKDGSSLERDGVVANVELVAGSWNSRGYDANVRGKYGDLSFSVTSRLYRSDEADLSGQGPWLSNDSYGNEDHWGPLIPHGTPDNPDYNRGVQNAGVPLGSYYDPTDDYGVQAKVQYKGFEVGILKWQRREAYGPYYSADHAQNNAFWNVGSMQLWASHVHDVSDELQLETLVSWRDSDIRGNWAEAFPDWREGREEYSYVSWTDWHSDSDAFLFKPLLRWQASERFQLSAGFKYERKDLTRAYAITGYYDAFSTAGLEGDRGPDGQGSGVYHSSRDTYESPPENSEEMPEENRILTDDIGGFVQATLDWDAFAFNFGLRHDVNSIYGASTNPRVAAIFKWSALVPAVDAAALKLIYGTAFQEPAPIQLFGGWQGRNANPFLEPETVQNIELNHLLRVGDFRLDLSGYLAQYDKVIVEASVNTGQRRVIGAEAKLYQDVPNPLAGGEDISVYAYYTYTQSQSNWVFDYDSGAWVENGSYVELGDISPHKVHAGATLPLSKYADLSVMGKWISTRRAYLANPLRDPRRADGGREIQGYPELNLNARAMVGPATLGLGIRNLLDQEYFHPGPEGASAGDDESAARSGGFHSSIVPTAGRSFWVTLDLELEHMPEEESAPEPSSR